MTQAYEYFSVASNALTAFFMFFQVAIYGDSGKGWIDRPWYMRLFMTGVGCSLVYKIWAFVRLHEHYTVGGSVVAYMLLGWQFTSLLYAITESYRQRSDLLVSELLPLKDAWGQHVPGYSLLKRKTKQSLISPVTVPSVFREPNGLNPMDPSQALTLWLVSVSKSYETMQALIAEMIVAK